MVKSIKGEKGFQSCQSSAMQTVGEMVNYRGFFPIFSCPVFLVKYTKMHSTCTILKC